MNHSGCLPSFVCLLAACGGDTRARPSPQTPARSGQNADSGKDRSEPTVSATEKEVVTSYPTEECFAEGKGEANPSGECNAGYAPNPLRKILGRKCVELFEDEIRFVGCYVQNGETWELRSSMLDRAEAEILHSSETDRHGKLCLTDGLDEFPTEVRNFISLRVSCDKTMSMAEYWSP